MAKFTLPLIYREKIAEQTMSFRFELGQQAFPFRPGQFVRVTLTNPPYEDAKGNSRSFSIASAPSEPFLLLAVRLTGSAFKRSLAEMPLDTPVNMTGPYGAFVLDANSNGPVTLFAGGIGITPFRSMIKDALDRPSPRPLTLLYANRTPEDAAFLDELLAWQRDASQFRLVAVMTQPEKSRQEWTGPTGHVNAAMLRETLSDFSWQDCYVAGPPRFVAGITQALTETGVRPEQIHEDEFIGY